MKAREMFEELGYSLKVDNNNLIEYSKEARGYTFFKFRLKYKEFCSGYQSVANTTTRDELKAVIQQFKELGWIEEEKPQETNFEHYKDEIIEDYSQSLAVVKGKPKLCYKTNCNDCDFKINQKGCRQMVKEWLKKPYINPKYKLSKFEYDMLDTIFDKKARFSKINLIGELKKKGYFENIKCDSNVRVEDILANCEVVG